MTKCATELTVDDPLPDVLLPLIAAHHSGEKLLLLFDYDGTVTPIVEYPWLAKLAPRTRELLSQLAALPSVHVGVLSGRRLEDVEQMVGIPGLLYSGLSGTELKLTDTSFVHPVAVETVPLIDEIVRRLTAAIEQVYPGAWVEHKRYGLTVHFRGVAPSLAEEARTRVLGFLECWTKQLRIVEAPRAVEVTVTNAGTKGEAVRKMMAHVGEPAFVCYAGDAANDSDAFAAVNSQGGITLSVGPEAPSSATAHLADPDMLVEWFDQLRHALQSAAVEV
jgi:trehalose 6-phosphate phosphatase